MRKENLLERVRLYPIDLLKGVEKLPKGFDVIWMSQFLCCFSEKEIQRIYDEAKEEGVSDPTMKKRVRKYLVDVYILEE